MSDEGVQVQKRRSSRGRQQELRKVSRGVHRHLVQSLQTKLHMHWVARVLCAIDKFIQTYLCVNAVLGLSEVFVQENVAPRFKKPLLNSGDVKRNMLI
jgi:hypothetical protein